MTATARALVREPVVTIDEAIARLDEILDVAERERDRIGYFAALYRRFTKLIADAIAAGQFLDRERMERFDAGFANRYFDAVYARRSGRALTASWKVSFDACARSDLTILQHLYAGLAAHQLLDLSVSAAETAPDSLIEDLAADFEHVNAIVGSAVKKVDGIIGQLSPRVGWIDRVAPSAHSATNRLAVFTARGIAWRTALKLAPLDDVARRAETAVLDRRVARVVSLIVKPPIVVRLVAGFVRRAEEPDVRHVIRLLAGREE